MGISSHFHSAVPRRGLRAGQGFRDAPETKLVPSAFALKETLKEYFERCFNGDFVDFFGWLQIFREYFWG